MLRWLRRLLLLAIVAGVALVAFAALRPPPQDLPWTPLRLDQPIGLFTGRKIAALTGQRSACLALLRATGIAFEPAPPRGEDRCRVADAVRIDPRQAMLALSPATVRPSCPVAVGLIAWQTEVVQPAAFRLLGEPVARLEHFGSYSCRRLYGRSTGAWSEHATADAIDISGFVLRDGRRVSVRGDWHDSGKKGAFLHAVRDGGCRVFATVLSPDYNAAHADHLHMDQADRGGMGWRACR
ncbi:MAG: extensin [Sphingomonas sp. 28-62-20]|nr:MAG: extensin [Sphingomonas sp. 28-62-20]